MHSPIAVLEKHIRALSYNNYLAQKEDKDVRRGFPAFIETKLWYELGSTIPITEIVILIETYKLETGDDSVMGKGKFSSDLSNSTIGNIITKSCSIVFGEECLYKRAPRPDANVVSPYVITNVRLRLASDNVETTTSHSFKPKSLDFKVSLSFLHGTESLLVRKFRKNHYGK